MNIHFHWDSDDLNGGPILKQPRHDNPFATQLRAIIHAALFCDDFSFFASKLSLSQLQQMYTKQQEQKPDGIVFRKPPFAW